MWSAERIDDLSTPTNLCHHDGRLYWLADDDDADAVEDTLGRTVPRKVLVSYAVDAGERRVLARALPPSRTLAAGDQGLFLWGLQRESVLQVSHDGDVTQFTSTEEQPDGDLRCVDGRLFFAGKLNPATQGVAVYEPELDDFRRVLETGDPTSSSLDRVDIAGDRVWHLTHDPRGWVLLGVDLDGEETEEIVTKEKLMCRGLLTAAQGFVIPDDHAVYHFAGGELRSLAECDLPPDLLAASGARVLWTTDGAEDAEGALVEPWRVHTAALQGDAASEVAYESNDRIASLVAGPWGCACLLRDAKVGVVAEIGTEVTGSVALVRSVSA